jgi:tetratricopeptide (TPR) repeat protein
LPEARNIFQQVVQQFANRPEGTEAALRVGQCLKDEGEQKIEQGRKIQAAAKKPEEAAPAQKYFDEGYKQVRESATYLETQAENLKTQKDVQDIRSRMYYEAAWSQRVLAEQEIRAAKKAIQDELIKKLGPKAGKLPPPDVPLDKVAVTPAEKKARGLYQTLVGNFSDLPLATEARFELAELLADRNEVDAAQKLLTDAMDKEPNPELSDKIRLRMGAIHAAKGNIKAALAQFEAVAANKKSKQQGWAHYRAGEAFLQNQQYPEAIKRLALFRDNGEFNNLPGLSDRALLRLGQAHALNRGWEESRQAYERLTGAFPNSPLIDEARYGMGWAMQQQKNYDGAVNAYTQVTQRTAAEVAAKAQLQIGLCRLEQQRHNEAATALLVVPFTYDYPELSAVALLEAARAFSEGKQPQQARKLLDRVLRDYPGTPYADAAKERLENLKK